MDILELLIKHNADVNSMDGWALQVAAADGRLDIVSKLLDEGADPNAWSELYLPATAIQAACESEHLEVAQILLDHGADPNRGSGTLSPPLIRAIEGEHKKIVKLLLAAKAQFNVHGGPEQSGPIFYAIWNMEVDTDMMSKLIEAGANIDDFGEDGETALMVAARYDDDDNVRFLLNHGADILHTNNNGKNAIQIAKAEESEDCLEMLVEHLSNIMKALKSAVDSDNADILNIVRTANEQRRREERYSHRSQKHRHGERADPRRRPRWGRSLSPERSKQLVPRIHLSRHLGREL